MAGLTESEYRHIQTHVYYTHNILSDIRGMEDITRWSSRHHEKLDGEIVDDIACRFAPAEA
ncbi:MAG: hypothetical protein LKJ80_00925 [Oscillibacter sp.]|jgi:HD-GYP domain-containing protein (c-di-GMP phosphodiesterase class II)|nr:hypothetical protein [Oscillibacter sp.]